MAKRKSCNPRCVGGSNIPGFDARDLVTAEERALFIEILDHVQLGEGISPEAKALFEQMYTQLEKGWDGFYWPGEEDVE